jgi:hypothetical protein
MEFGIGIWELVVSYFGFKPRRRGDAEIQITILSVSPRLCGHLFSNQINSKTVISGSIPTRPG